MHVPPELEPARDETKAYFYEAFKAAWTAIDVPDPSPATLPLRTHPWRSAVLARVRRSRWRDHIQRVLPPVGSPLGPVARMVCAGVGRAALKATRRVAGSTEA